MKKIITSLLLLCVLSSSAQLNQQPLRSTISIKGFNLFQETQYLVSADVVGNDEYLIIISKNDNPDKKVSFKLHPLTIDGLKNGIQEKLTSLDADYKSKISKTKNMKSADALDQTWQNEAERLFYIFKSSEITALNYNDRPLAGTLHIKKERIELERTDADVDKEIEYKVKCMFRTAGGLFGGGSYARTEEDYKNGEKMNYKAAKEFCRRQILQDHRSQANDHLGKVIDEFTNLGITIDSTKTAIRKLVETVAKEKETVSRVAVDVDGQIHAIRDSTLVRLERQRLSVPGIKNLFNKKYSSTNDLEETLEPISNALNKELLEDTRAVTNYTKYILDNKRAIDSITKLINTRQLDTFSSVSALLTCRRLTEDIQRYMPLKESNKEAVLIVTNIINEAMPEFRSLAEKKINLNNAALTRTGNNLSDSEKSKKLNRELVASEHKRDALVDTEVANLFRSVTLPFKLQSVNMEVNQGFIENISVVGTIDTDKLFDIYSGKLGNAIANHPLSDKVFRFENKFPIGFSIKRDFEGIKGIGIYLKDGYAGYTLYLKDLFDYEQDHQVGRRDYSPENKMVHFGSDQPENNIKLYKEQTYRLFEAKVFTDFVGLNGTSANGLIQTELDKRINVWTRRFSKNGYTNIVFFHYAQPSVSLSKWEETNKYLQLSGTDVASISGGLKSSRYASTIDLKRYESFNVGLDANLFLLDMPTLKSTVYINAGFRFGTTNVRDSLRGIDTSGSIARITASNIVNDISVVSHQFYPEILWDIKADERYGFSLSYRPTWFKSRSDAFTQVASIADIGSKTSPVVSSSTNWMHTFQLIAYFRPSDDSQGRLFFRYRYNWQHDFSNIGYQQIQIGYSFYLLGQSR
jgi:hypothetical protein